MAVEHVQLVAQMELQLMDPVGIAVSGLDVLNGAVVDQLLDLGNGHLIAGEPGVVVDHHADIQSGTDITEMLHDSLLMGIEVVGQDHHHTVGAAVLSVLAHLDGVQGVIAAGTADQRHLTVQEGGHVADDLTLLLHVHGDVLASAAADGDGLSTVVQQPGQVLLHALLVVGLVSVPDGHGRRTNTIGLLGGFFHFHDVLPFPF